MSKLSSKQTAQSWPHVRLGKVCQIVPGRHIVELDHNREKRGVPYLTGPSDFGELQATPSRWTEKPDVMCQPQDVLVTVKGAGVANLNFAPDEPTCIGRQLMAVRAKSGVTDSGFVYYALSWLNQRLKEQAMGATVPGLSIEHLANLQFELPPLAEQRRIAGRLREQLAAVAQARAAVQAQLDAAEALPAAHLRAVFNGCVAQSWPRRRLGDLLRLRKEVVHPRNNPRGPATFVGLEHTESNTGRRIGSLPLEMSELTGRKPRFYQGDIVYGYLRPYLNKVWIAEFDGLCSVDQYVYEVNQAEAQTEFLAWFMRSPTYLKRAPVAGTPGQLPRIRTEEVAAVEVNLPPLATQRKTVEQIQAEFGECTQLRNSLADKLTALDHLPAALLREAFGGGRSAGL